MRPDLAADINKKTIAADHIHLPEDVPICKQRD